MKQNTTMVWLVAALMLGATACGSKNTTPEQPQEAKRETYTVKPQTAQITLKYPATMRGEQEIAIYPQIEGKIVKVCVEEGQRVKRGQPLFVIDQTGYKASLETASANVLSAQARLESARLALQSKRQLREQGVVASYAVEQAQNALLTAKADLAQAKAERKNAANNLSYTVVRSTADGVIGTLPYKTGALVGANMPQPLTHLSDNKRMVAHFALTEQQLTSLYRQHGGKQKALQALPHVTWQASDGTRYAREGRVETISGVLNEATGSASVRAVFDNAEEQLLSGATGNILMTMTLNGAVVVPQTAVTEMQDRHVVYRMVKGKPTMTFVKLHPLNDGNNYIITQGLRPGDVIVR